MESWCRLHGHEWLSWRSLAAVACCSSSVRVSVCHGPKPVLDLAEGRLAVLKGLPPSHELQALHPVDNSEDIDEKENLLTRVAEYFSDSSVGRSLFKPSVFHIWPSPTAYVAGALNGGGYNLSLFYAMHRPLAWKTAARPG
ncbi:unnamed protein product [Polarella glacialis]|uniref:Uncharacterized protein n=1 Tax=Polarella glacialis TaxID=89957 RepID=A0A813KYB7_POLGL|nr:unnamed protein product [Polarella glacialis]